MLGDLNGQFSEFIAAIRGIGRLNGTNESINKVVLRERERERKGETSCFGPGRRKNACKERLWVLE